MIAVASPNIAFIKYWGKLDAQRDEDRNLATNPSFSLTLSKAQTRADVRRIKGDAHEILINEQAASAKDVAKISEHVTRVERALGHPAGHYRIETGNNFPAGAGIASSASAYAALSLALAGELVGEREAERFLGDRNAELSALARRGSGSAGRSVAGPYMRWDGAHATRFDSDWRLRDTILILSREHKAVPSSEGHKLVRTSPHFAARLGKVPERLAKVERAIRHRDLPSLGRVIEEEALELHRIARSGTPPVDYLLPETRRVLEAIEKLGHRNFFFTLDAGPNVHLISETSIAHEIEPLLARLGVQAEIWEDQAGDGPRLIK